MTSLRGLKLFRSIMYTGSLSKSATELNVSQPTASGRLKRFEESIGIRLFDRVNFGLSPTPEAMQLLPEVDKIFRHLEHFEVKISNIAGGGNAFLSVQSIPSMSKYFITPTLKLFSELHPNLRLSIHSAQSSQVISNIEIGTFDVGFVYGFRESVTLEYIPLEKIHFACIMRKDNQLAEKKVIDIKELSEQKLIMNRSSTALRRSVDSTLLQNGFSLKPMVEAGTIQAYDLITGGLGVGILDSSLLSENAHPDLIFRPLSIEIEVQACIIHNKFTPLSHFARQYIEIVKSYFIRDYRINKQLFSPKLLRSLSELLQKKTGVTPLRQA